MCMYEKIYVHTYQGLRRHRRQQSRPHSGVLGGSAPVSRAYDARAGSRRFFEVLVHLHGLFLQSLFSFFCLCDFLFFFFLHPTKCSSEYMTSNQTTNSLILPLICLPDAPPPCASRQRARCSFKEQSIPMRDTTSLRRWMLLAAFS